jgi:hypothetical protein
MSIVERNAQVSAETDPETVAAAQALEALNARGKVS